ncbi:hypothetical protein QQ045_003513 [Rhodiola kirilowii]
MKARLDRAFGNMAWKILFSGYVVTHLISSVSDHLPLLLLVNFQVKIQWLKKKLFRFEPMWLRHKDFRGFMESCWGKRVYAQMDFFSKLKSCKKDLKQWNSEIFGKVHKRISGIKKELEDLQSKFRTEEIIKAEAQLRGELDEWLVREELMWRQRSRVEWLREEDSNTKYFHFRASQRRKKNTVSRIKDSNGRWITDEVGICKEAVNYFSNIFKTSYQGDELSWEESLSIIDSSVSSEQSEFLRAPFTQSEVQNAIIQIGSTKAPGSDGYSALFDHKNWRLIKDEVTQYSLRILNGGGLVNSELNETLITLVPKTRCSITFNEFRPFSLCNVAMKLITKGLANRLKEVLQSCISPSQGAFVPGRLISDNILIAHELMNYMRTRADKSIGYCCIKVDMSKAYDRMEWRFLEEIQKRMGFPDSWIAKVMSCVNSVAYKIRVNDIISEPFFQERGIRQGDPLSPYLFVLCMDWLARRMEKAQVTEEIHGIKVSRTAPSISHLLFADDCMIFV